MAGLCQRPGNERGSSSGETRGSEWDRRGVSIVSRAAKGGKTFSGMTTNDQRRTSSNFPIVEPFWGMHYDLHPSASAASDREMAL